MLPFEFIVDGPPVSHQTRNPDRLRAWQLTVRTAAMQYWPTGLLPIATRLKLLNQEQYQTLQKGLQTRNLFVHGYKPKQSFSQLLNDLLLIVDQLMTHEEPAFH